MIGVRGAPRLYSGPGLAPGPVLPFVTEDDRDLRRRVDHWLQWHRRPPLPRHRRGSRTLAGPLALVVVVDVSASMDFADPAGLRWSDCHHVFEHLASDPDGRKDDTASVVTFAASAAATGPGRLARLRDRQRLRSFLQGPPALTPGTDLLPAVDEAASLLAQAPSGSEGVVILVTDGDVFLGPDQVAAALVRLGAVPVHLVAADCDGTFSRNEAAWAATPLASVATVRRPVHGDFAAAVCAAADAALGRR